MEFMVNGSRCTIYTAFYDSTPVIVKVMRKDVQDKETVRQVRAGLFPAIANFWHRKWFRVVSGTVFCLGRAFLLSARHL